MKRKKNEKWKTKNENPNQDEVLYYYCNYLILLHDQASISNTKSLLSQP